MFRKCLMLFAFFCTASTYLHAQTLYNLKYTYDTKYGPEQYNAFMVRYDDGTGFIRVKFANAQTHEEFLIDMNMEENFEVDKKTGQVDSSLLYFDGIDPVVIAGDTTKGYDPDTYVFVKQPNSEYYEPLEVISEDDKQNVYEGKFSEVNLIDASELTEDFVSQFFFKDEEFYKSLFETSVRTLTTEDKATTLHLIIVANTNDPDIGSTCVLDKDRTLKTFTDLAEYMQLRLDTTVIFGATYNKQNVENAISGVRISPKDILIFYYSGHGFTKNDQYQFPYMELRSKSYQDLDQNSLNIEEVYNRLKQKGARVTLVYSDCCNTTVGTPPAVSGEVASTRGSALGWNLNNCFQLFLPTAPISILMTAAARGEMSAGNNNYGGFFTSNFRAALTNYLSPTFILQNVSWQKLIEEAQTQTVKKANNTLCNLPDGTKARCVQHPMVKMF